MQATVNAFQGSRLGLVLLARKSRGCVLDLARYLMKLGWWAHSAFILALCRWMSHRVRGLARELRQLGGPRAIVPVELTGRFSAGRLLYHGGASPF